MHTCHAIECKTAILPTMFMCKPHWFSLPKSMRSELWRTYRVGQCEDWDISEEYAKAAQTAIRFVAEKEGREVTGEEPELELYNYLKRKEG